MWHSKVVEMQDAMRNSLEDLRVLWRDMNDLWQEAYIVTKTT